MTQLGKDILKAAAERCETSVSEVNEHLARLYGGTVQRSDFAPLAPLPTEYESPSAE